MKAKHGFTLIAPRDGTGRKEGRKAGDTKADGRTPAMSIINECWHHFWSPVVFVSVFLSALFFLKLRL